MGEETSPPSGEVVPLQESWLVLVMVQEETLLADQFTFVVLPLLTREGTTLRSRRGEGMKVLVLLFPLKPEVVEVVEVVWGFVQEKESVAQLERLPFTSSAKTLTVLLPSMEYVLFAVS